MNDKTQNDLIEQLAKINLNLESINELMRIQIQLLFKDVDPELVK